MKRKTRVFVSDFSFFSLHSWTKELKKDEIWDKNTILQPIEKSYNDFNAFFAKVMLCINISLSSNYDLFWWSIWYIYKNIKIIKMQRLLWYLLILFSFCGFSQNQIVFKGKIISDATDIEGVLIKNISSKQETYSYRGGYFSINGKQNDTLMFSAFNLKATMHIIKEKDFGENLIFIPMPLNRTELKELAIIDYKSINAVSLGIVPANQITYTPAERKLKTASDYRPESTFYLGGLTGVSLSFDAILNAISGRTNMLKKELVVENKEQLQVKLANKYDKEYIINTLKIPEEYVEGFVFYTAENNRFAEAMRVKNYTMATFILSELATKYRELQGF